MLGGQYRPDRMDTVGPMAAAALDQLRGFKAFLGADGLSLDFGMTAGDIESAHIYRQALRNARQRILLVDYSKFLSPSLFKIESFEVIDRVITDRKPPKEWIEYLTRMEIDLTWPDMEDTNTLENNDA
jgi:DeoR/GlpR family transcriptional regulator of sugar metabolism